MWTGLVWLKIGTGGEFLRIRYLTFGFYKMLGNYRVSKQLVLSSMELVGYIGEEEIKYSERNGSIYYPIHSVTFVPK
jgi:hypothetical protein